MDVNLTDGQTHNLELYLLDWDSNSRVEQVQVSDATTGAVLDTQSVSSFHSGVYLDYAVSGHVSISFTTQAGANAVLSGLFFGGATSTTVPQITSETPVSGATGITTNTEVTATFNEAVQASSISSSNYQLRDAAGNLVPVTVSYDSSTKTATLAPSSPLANSTTYTASISGVIDNSGHVMSGPVSWSFTTAAGQPTSSGDPTTLAPSLACASQSEFQRHLGQQRVCPPECHPQPPIGANGRHSAGDLLPFKLADCRHQQHQQRHDSRGDRQFQRCGVAWQRHG